MIHGLGCGVPAPHGESDPAWYATATAALRPAWFYTWRADAIGQPGFVPMCWRMDIDSILPAVDVALANAASVPLWLIGNEPEREEQSDTPAHIAAAACREWVRRCGTWAIPWAAPGVNVSIHMAGMGYAWMEGFLACGGPIPPAFHVHIYGNADAWRESVKRFHAWMRMRRVERPVIVSEAGCADDPVGLFAAIRHSLSSGEVQAAAIFSARYEPWPDCDLLTDDGELTALGRLFVSEVMPAGDGGHTLHLPAVFR